MEDEAGINEVVIENDEKTGKEEVFTKVIRAGKRTYFFDVKATRREEYYVTITESKKRLGKDGKVYYEKHKIFLYKEDFEKFTSGLKDVIDFINENNKVTVNLDVQSESKQEKPKVSSEEFTDVSFDDLGKK
jgi:hypothetical protein